MRELTVGFRARLVGVGLGRRAFLGREQVHIAGSNLTCKLLAALTCGDIYYTESLFGHLITTGLTSCSSFHRFIIGGGRGGIVVAATPPRRLEELIITIAQHLLVILGTSKRLLLSGLAESALEVLRAAAQLLLHLDEATCSSFAIDIRYELITREVRLHRVLLM